MRPRRRGAIFAVLGAIVVGGVLAGVDLTAAAPAAVSRGLMLHARVVPADRYCVLRRSGYGLRRCRSGSRRLVRLGGRYQEWLVIFSFRAPKAMAPRRRRYYYFTADGPSGCPNARQFGDYDREVHKGQRVVQWVAFDKDCPGPGHGSVSLLQARSTGHWPGQGVRRFVARFRFTVP